MLIDTHCHLHDREFFTEAQAEAMLKNARQNHVSKIICIGTSHQDSLAACQFAAEHPDVYWTYGIHPEQANNYQIPARPFKNPPVAIGEVGLDYHYDGYNRQSQIRLFEEMLQLALDYDLPLSFHVREAFDDFFAVIANFPEAHGVVHSFTDSKKTLKRILTNTSFYVGVNGLATYSTLPLPPLERILLETDAPFLAPIPHRGETNQPAYVANVAKWLADTLQLPLSTVATTTTNSAQTLFNFAQPQQ